MLYGVQLIAKRLLVIVLYAPHLYSYITYIWLHASPIGTDISWKLTALKFSNWNWKLKRKLSLHKSWCIRQDCKLKSKANCCHWPSLGFYVLSVVHHSLPCTAWLSRVLVCSLGYHSNTEGTSSLTNLSSVKFLGARWQGYENLPPHNLLANWKARRWRAGSLLPNSN